MNWFGGSIAEAVSKSKVKNAIFVVFVEGTGDDSQKLKAIIDDTQIRSVLESDNFIAIKISSSSEAYMQFARIYKMVPIPSVFFIGSAGEPLEIITSSVTDTNSFFERVNQALVGAGKVSTGPAAVGTTKAQKEIANKMVTLSAEQPETNITGQSSSSAVTGAKPIQKQNTAPMTEEEAELYGPVIKHYEAPQEDSKSDVKEDKSTNIAIKLVPTIKRNSQTPQIDTVNRSKLNTESSSNQTDSIPNANVELVDDAMRSVRVQFRFKNGDTATHTFTAADQFKAVRAYVKQELIPGTGIRGFTLTTVYPKRELKPEIDNQSLMDLELFPSCALLIIEKDAGSSSILTQSSMYNVVKFLICTLFAPIFRGYDYLRQRFTANKENNKSNLRGDRTSALASASVSSSQRNQQRTEKANQDGASKFNDNPTSTTTAYRRFGSNIHRLSDHRGDSDDENATWNGNSTQQK